MGQRATVSGGAVFDDVPVDPELVVPYQSAFEAPQQFGARAQLVHAAEALLASAAAVLNEITRTPENATAAARGSLAIAEAKAFGSEVAAEVASEMFTLSGASAADERYDLSRHWRNARTHASHDPVAWKYHHVGSYLLNDVLPPNHGLI